MNNPVARIACSIGLHAWWYVDENLSYRKQTKEQRVCSTCPKKQHLLNGKWCDAE